MAERDDSDSTQIAPPQPGAQPAEQHSVYRRAEFTYHQGPLPPADVLEAYNRIIPDAANRILTMAEKQSSHRMYLERIVVESDIRRSYAGLGAGLVVAILFLVAGVELVRAGYETAGTIMGTADLAALVGVFIYGSAQRQRERIEKAKVMSGQRELEQHDQP